MIMTLILVPLIGAILTFLMNGRPLLWTALLSAAATLGSTLSVVVEIWRDGPRFIYLGNWAPPLGIQLYLDGLTLLMLIMTASIGFLISLYAAFYFSVKAGRSETHSFFWPLWLVLWAALNGLYLVSDVFTIYLLLEVSLLSSVALATLSDTRAATVAALRYLIAAMTGSLAYLLGVGILYNLHGTIDLFSLAASLRKGGPAEMALLLMTAGLLVKAAVFPLHFWLPPAHASAPAPVSAILSAVVVKGAFYVLLRLWMELGESAVSYAAGQVLGGLAAGAILWGSFQALRQTQLKMLVAYSTVAQIGFFFLLFPSLASGGSESAAVWQIEAWSGGSIQATAHGLAKASLFISAGVIILARGSDDLAKMRGLILRMPITILALLLAGLALYGLPSSGSDLGKKMLVNAALADGQWWWEPFVKTGSLLTLGYTVMMLRYSVLREREKLTFRKVPTWVQCIPLLLALASIAFAWPHEQLLDLLLIGHQPDH